MPYYAQIDSNGVVSAVTETHSVMEADHMVPVDELDTSLLGRTYDAETGMFGDPPAPPAPEWEWFIDVGPFFDRFGAAKMAVLTSTDAGVRAILSDLQVRKWIDLQREDVFLGLQYVGSEVPAVTAEMQEAILTTPVALAENLALRKQFFS